MNSKDDFPWKENGLLKEAYKQDNYLVSETGSKTGQAVIFFSSNGIYYPNDEETFRAYIQKGNEGFEWFHLAQHREIQNHFEKIIFVRDVYKQWYVTGINERLDSVDKVLSFLQEQTGGAVSPLVEVRQAAMPPLCLDVFSTPTVFLQTPRSFCCCPTAASGRLSNGTPQHLPAAGIMICCRFCGSSPMCFTPFRPNVKTIKRSMNISGSFPICIFCGYAVKFMVTRWKASAGPIF